MRRRILVTGASGFIGSHLVPALEADGFEVAAWVREADGCASGQQPTERLAAALRSTDTVIHLAAIAHQRASAAAFAAVNGEWPVRLYHTAAAAGVAHFVFLSSLKVLGDVSEAPLAETAAYRPGDPYARSKMQAEVALQAAAAGAATGLSIIRPPLVYGPGVRANFLSLLELARFGHRGLPLPLGAARAPRSLIGVRNLVSLVRCVTRTGPAGIVHGADPEDLGVAALLGKLGAERLPAVPAALLRPVFALFGRRRVYQRLFQPLQIDQRRTAARLGWVPPFGGDEQLAETLAWFRSR